MQIQVGGARLHDSLELDENSGKERDYGKLLRKRLRHLYLAGESELSGMPERTGKSLVR